jgi:hypothetical protein
MDNIEPTNFGIEIHGLFSDYHGAGNNPRFETDVHTTGTYYLGYDIEAWVRTPCPSSELSKPPTATGEAGEHAGRTSRRWRRRRRTGRVARSGNTLRLGTRCTRRETTRLELAAEHSDLEIAAKLNARIH